MCIILIYGSSKRNKLWTGASSVWFIVCISTVKWHLALAFLEVFLNDNRIATTKISLSLPWQVLINIQSKRHWPKLWCIFKPNKARSVSIKSHVSTKSYLSDEFSRTFSYTPNIPALYVDLSPPPIYSYSEFSWRIFSPRSRPSTIKGAFSPLIILFFFLQYFILAPPPPGPQHSQSCCNTQSPITATNHILSPVLNLCLTEVFLVVYVTVFVLFITNGDQQEVVSHRHRGRWCQRWLKSHTGASCCSQISPHQTTHTKKYLEPTVRQYGKQRASVVIVQHPSSFNSFSRKNHWSLLGL